MRLTLGLVPYGLVNTGLSVFIPDKMLSFTLAVMVAAIFVAKIYLAHQASTMQATGRGGEL